MSADSDMGELWLDSRVLRDIQGASRLEQKVAEIFELLRDPIYRYVCRLIGKRAEAEDLTQEAFLRLYDNLQKGHAMGNVRPWLYRVAHNLAIDWLRQQGRLEQIEVDALPMAAVIDAAPNAEQRLLAGERHKRLRVLLSQLSPQQRHCMFLRAEGLSYREIGEVLGIGVSSVATFLGRAIKRIAEDANEQ
ncbi:MAG: RNA polymerase sigma factor [Blastocatellales bacterium]